MKKIALFVAVASLIGWSGMAFADGEGSTVCPIGQKLKLVGSLKTGATAFGQTGAVTAAGGLISSYGVDVRMIVVTCGGTACVAAFTNVANNGAAVSSDYVIEPGAAANTSAVLDFTKTPLSFSTAISVGDTSGNVQSVGVYACQ